MRVRIARTREDQEPGERDNALIGEVCPACLEGGAAHIEAKLEERARLSRVIAEQDEQNASEGVEDLPSVDDLLVAETYYGDRG
jgi:hypothetical protein